MIEIKSWRDGRVLYTAENAADVRTALLEAVKANANLGFANLRFANLGFADLRSANLGFANLGFADLRSANLGFADLRFANLGSADLRSADLRSANLGFADLRSADLRSADLRSANLGFADLGSADLRSANLSPRHALWAFRMDLWSILDQAPAEVKGLRKAIAGGKIDGSVYEGKCACLVGTIAKVAKVSIAALPIARDGSRPAEQWFIPIREGDKPVALDKLPKDVSEGVFRASWALVWVDEWSESRKAISEALAA